MKTIRELVAVLLLVFLMVGCEDSSGWEEPVPYVPPSVDEVVAALDGLDVDAFFDQSYRHLLGRDPEALTAIGIEEDFGLHNEYLTEISDEYIRETYDVVDAILELLRGYDRQSLTPDQRLSYDVYVWYLDDWAREREFMYYDYPVHPGINSYPSYLTWFLTDLHPVSDRRDAEDYILRLRQVDDRMAELVDGLRLREQAGMVPPRFIIQYSLYQIDVARSGTARSWPLYQTFESKLNALEQLDAAEKSALLNDAEQAIEHAVIPGFQELVGFLEHLESVAPTNDGVWQFHRGEDYYRYTLRHHTTTDLTADQIHQLGLEEIERIHAEMRVLFDQLGYPQDESLAELFDRVIQDGGFIPEDQVVATYEQIIEQAKQNLDSAFDIFPKADVIVIGGPTGGYYMAGSADGSRPGVFYAHVSGPEPWYGMPTLTYHEAIPGHHTQVSIAQELEGLPYFRTDVSFTAFAEGWALYAERLAGELGWYAEDIFGNLGRLQYEALRAARLVVDTGIHEKRWTFQQALDYLNQNVGFDPNVLNLEYSVSRYIAWPGQATAYKVGMLELDRLRQLVQKQLGSGYDLKAFHRLVLASGGVPLPVLTQVVQDYIDAQVP